MMKDVEKEQADRIFRLAGSERIGGDGRRISLEEFRKMLERDPKSNKKNHPKQLGRVYAMYQVLWPIKTTFYGYHNSNVLA